ncbi:MAG: phosphatidylglycerophosphatase A [Bacteroidaceae bacterium]|nr:phosphatidylglycerophosphatase A [Bacteroidaceae bacterium]
MNKMPFFHRMVATSLGAGYFPYGPGTMGALLGIAVWAVVSRFVDYTTLQLTLSVGIVVFTILGVWSSSVAERYWGKDPSRVVIDETVGEWITLWAVPATLDWRYVLAAFVLFRFFDIVKPLGVRQMEKLKGGYGIMADDILAGIYGALILFIAHTILD